MSPPTPADDTLVRIRGLKFYRGSRAIFDGVDIDIPRGAVTAIMGPSGTGKTTLLKLIGGQLRPDAGTIEVDGQNVHALSKAELYRLRMRMGMLFQSGALLTDLSVFDNVAYPLREHTRLNPSMVRKLVLMKLEAVGLRGAQGLMPSQLSGGMARRVALARAIAVEQTVEIGFLLHGVGIVDVVEVHLCIAHDRRSRLEQQLAREVAEVRVRFDKVAADVQRAAV